MFSRYIHAVACISTSLSWLNNIPSYVYHMFCLFTHLLMYTCVVSSVHLETLVYRHLFETLLPILLHIYIRLDLLCPMTILYLIFWRTAKPFSIATVPLYIEASNALISPHSHPHLSFCCFDNSHPSVCVSKPFAWKELVSVPRKALGQCWVVHSAGVIYFIPAEEVSIVGKNHSVFF